MSKKRPKKKMMNPPRPAEPCGPVIVSLDGKNIRAWDTVCVCGHWASTHRSSTRTCEGFRCGCFTFRPVEMPDKLGSGPKCQVCDALVIGKRSRVEQGSLTVSWVHAKGEGAVTVHTTQMALPVIVGHGYECSPGDCVCGLGNNWRQGDPVPDGSGVVRQEPKLYNSEGGTWTNMPAALQAEPVIKSKPLGMQRVGVCYNCNEVTMLAGGVTEFACPKCSTWQKVDGTPSNVKVNEEKLRERKRQAEVNAYLVEVAEEQARRAKPQRARREEGIV